MMEEGVCKKTAAGLRPPHSIFNAGAELDDGWDADRIRPACLQVREVSGVQEAFRRVFGVRQRAIHALMDAIGSREIAAGV
jgi:hypothetical protein